MTEEGNSITCNDEDINYDGTIPSAYANSSMNLNYDSSSSFFFHSIKKENDTKNEEDSCNCFPFNLMNESDRPTANTIENNQTVSEGYPQTNETNFFSNAKSVPLDFDCEIYKQTQFDNESTKTKKSSKKGNRRDYPFEVTTPKVPKRDRRDYYLLKVKNSVCKFIKNILNYYGRSCKLTFYAPDADSFTKNINYEDNRKWLNWTVRRIITTYDFKGIKNQQTLMKMVQFEHSINFSLVNSFLLFTFEKVIEIYANSKQYESDLSKLDDISKVKFNELLKGKYENTFIYKMKYTKGNKKKKVS